MNLVPNEIIIKKIDNSIVIKFNRRKLGFSDYLIFLSLGGFLAAAVFSFVNTNEMDNLISYGFLFFVVIIATSFFVSMREKQKIVINMNSIEIIDDGFIPFKKVIDKKAIDRIYLKQIKVADCMFNPFLMLKTHAFNFFVDYFIPQIVLKGENYSFIKYYSRRTKQWLVEYLNQNV